MNRDARSLEFNSLHLAGLTQGVETTACCRFATAERPAKRNWLARDHAKFGVAAHHRDGVHDPGHRLFIGVDIRRGDIAIGTDDGCDLKRITTRQALQLIYRKGFWIADYAAFAAAIRNADRGALPGHPRRERFHFIERHIWVVAYAALARSAGYVVLYAVALEDLNITAVHFHRN